MFCRIKKFGNVLKIWLEIFHNILTLTFVFFVFATKEEIRTVAKKNGGRRDARQT